MIELGFAVLLAATCAGWSWFNVRMSMAIAESARGLEVIDRIGAKQDERIKEIATIAEKRLRERYAPQAEAQNQGPTVLDDQIEALREARRRGTPIMYSEPDTGEHGTGIPEMPLPVEG